MTRAIPERRKTSSLKAQGEPMIWLTGGMFAIACSMILGLLALVLYQGLSTLWPRPYSMYSTLGNELVGGELQGNNEYVLSGQTLEDLDPNTRVRAEKLLDGASEIKSRRLYLRTGNFELTNRHFTFLPTVALSTDKPVQPKSIWLLERREWGNLYGFPKSLSWTEANESNIADLVQKAMHDAEQLNRKIEAEKHKLERIDRAISNARLDVRRAELAEKVELQAALDQATAEAMAGNASGSVVAIEELPALQGLSTRATRAIVGLIRKTLDSEPQLISINEQIAKLEEERRGRSVVMQTPVMDNIGTADIPPDQWFPAGSEKTIGDKAGAALPQAILDAMGSSDAIHQIFKTVSLGPQQWLVSAQHDSKPPVYFWAVQENGASTSVYGMREQPVLVADIVRLIQPNQLSWLGRCGVYTSRWLEFLFGQPREAGVEGGFFPAIWGTIVMTLVMSLAVMPFGVLAALYMREYASSGWLLSLIRISINNLAGVPSIVYGVFGLAFFCYTIGGYIDGGPAKAGFEPWPSTVWFSAFAGLAVTGLVAFGVSILSGPRDRREGTGRSILGAVAGLLWIATLVGMVILLAKIPFFSGFYQAQLPNPTFGKGCLLWAACTLALLTLPVVIVATEEALAAVPNSLREGSYACGAGKWQTIQRIVLPYARPGIITGFILAMARGAGEVAPMMLVGAIPLATELPLDLDFPFLHGSRSFMHLGFQIYSLGFQSQNSEAAKPMVFTATLLLLVLVTLLNLTAIWLRASLRKRFQTSQF